MASNIESLSNDEVFRAQARLVELIASDEPLDMLLSALVLFVEQFASETCCSILIADTVTGALSLGAAPSLTPAHLRAASDVHMFHQGNDGFSTSGAPRELLVITEIASSTLPHSFRSTARAAGLKACWSLPLLNKTQSLIGTFTMYCRESRPPAAIEVELLHIAASFAGIVIQKFRDTEIYQYTESQYRELVERCPDPIIAHVTGRLVFINQAGRALLQISDLSLHSHASLGTFVPPDLLDAVVAHQTGLLSTQIKLSSGELLQVEITAARLTFPDQLATMLVVRNITQRKVLENGLFDAENRQLEHLAFDLHDGLGQQLTGISLLLRAVTGDLGMSLRDGSDDLKTLSDLVAKSISDVRIIAGTMSPGTVERIGLAGALHILKQKAETIYGLATKLSLQPSAGWTIDSHDANHLFRIVQEAIGNVARHAKANKVDIYARVERGDLVISISDNGIGITDDVVRATGLGLRSMRYRAERIGGDFDIKSVQPHGTTVKIRYPLRSAAQ